MVQTRTNRILFFLAFTGILFSADVHAVKQWTFSSMVVTHTSTASVYPGCKNVEMIRIELIGLVSGSGGPGGEWGVDAITITLSNTLDSDLDNVKLWWDVADDGVFDPLAETLLGTDASPSGTSVFNFTDQTDLRVGSYYMFVTYDIKSSISCGSGNTYDCYVAANSLTLETATMPNCDAAPGGDCSQDDADKTAAGNISMSACDVSVGGLAITGYDGSGVDDKLSLVALEAISSGTAINITDVGWTAAGAWRIGSEGILAWTTGALACGDEVLFTGTGGTWVVDNGSLVESGTFDLNMTGESIIAYQGSGDCVSFIYGFNNVAGGGWNADATTAQTSSLPLTLTNGTNAVAPSHFDNLVYDCSTNSGAAAILAAVSTAGNWTGDNTDPSGLTFPPAACTMTCGGCSEPGTAPPAPTYASITTTTFTINWGATGGPNYLVVVKSGSAVTA
ncbi:MAG: hypothetical protein JKX73_05880, partial [Flavobacteriales bacterium]|nr:hypothetical protein [Flavobacteriales bacterium]